MISTSQMLCFETLGNLILEELKLIRKDMNAEIALLRKEIKLHSNNTTRCNEKLQDGSAPCIESCKNNTVQNVFPLLKMSASVISETDLSSFALDNVAGSREIDENQQPPINTIELIKEKTVPLKLESSDDESKYLQSYPSFSPHSHRIEEVSENIQFNSTVIPVSSSLDNDDFAFEITNDTRHESLATAKLKSFDRDDVLVSSDRDAEKGNEKKLDFEINNFKAKQNLTNISADTKMDKLVLVKKCDTAYVSSKDESNPNFMCKYCRKPFRHFCRYEAHLRKHTGEKPFKCDLCPKSFSQKTNLKNHMYYHSKEKPFVCNVCDKGFTLKASLKSHFLTHTGEKPFKCEVCNKGFSQKTNLKSHMYLHTKEKPFVCSICSKGFTQKSTLKNHMVLHTGTTPHCCQICGKSFANKGNLNQHLNRHKMEFPCTICEKRFGAKSQLMRHLRTHTGEKPYVCTICNKAFAIKGNLNQHMRRHKNSQAFSCDFCDKRYLQKSSLIIHMRGHTGEKPFQCDVCSKAFTNKPSLQIHKTRHSKEKPFACHLCDKAFRQKSYLAAHLNRHKKGTSLYQCGFCKKRFKKHVSLVAHQLIHTM